MALREVNTMPRQFDREKAAMYESRQSRVKAHFTARQDGRTQDFSNVDILHAIIKRYDPDLEGSEIVRKSYISK